MTKKPKNLVVTVASMKGGVGKTTTAIHLAAELAKVSDAGTTLLIDGDGTRSASAYQLRANLAESPLPFDICSESQAVLSAASGQYRQFILDTPANPSIEELTAAAERAHLTVIPLTPDAMSLDATVKMIQRLKGLTQNYRLLITMLPRGGKTGDEILALLKDQGIPCFSQTIRKTSAFLWASSQGSLVENARSESGKHKLAGIAAKEYRAVAEEALALVC